MKLFILALVLYFQNFFFSLFASFVFIPSFIEFASVYILVLLISKTEYKKSLFLFWQFLYLIHFGFISFFGRIITSSDIYLFFTHIVETYETFIYTLDIFIVPFIITMLIFIIVLNIKIKSTKINVYALLFAFATLLIFMPNKIYDASFLLLKSIASTTTIKSSDIKLEANLTKKLISLKKQDINIVLLIGESMRAKEYQNKEYEIFKNYFYKTIYAGATSTDLSLPLLINGAVKPSEINLSNNIFTLAKENDFKTAFITVQSKKSLKYIKPYLHLEDIESFKLLGSRDDMDLLKEFKKIDLQNQTNFVVMQMQGQHSPYIYYPEYKKSTILEQYNESMDYSNRVISEMIKYIKTLKKQTIFIFSSDHGELIGERGKIGHNTFQKEVYKVPLIIFDTLNSDIEYQNMEAHNDIYNLIFYLLGYSKEFREPSKSIRVNGSMINEEDGYMEF